MLNSNSVVRFMLFTITAVMLYGAQDQLLLSDSHSGKASSHTMMPMPLIAPLFIQDADTDSVATMVSNSSHPLRVDITLSSLSGVLLVKKSVVVGPHSQQVTKISELLRGVSSEGARVYGSAILLPEKPSSLAAQLSITSINSTSTNDVEEEFMMSADSKFTKYRATMSDVSATPILAIHSTSTTEQRVQIGCISSSKPLSNNIISIAPNQTLLIQACSAGGPRSVKSLDDIPTEERQNHSVGISVSSSARANELTVFGIAMHDRGSKRSISSIPFWNVASLKSSTAIYPGVPIAPSPAFGTVPYKLRASIANFGGIARKATVVLCTGSEGESSKNILAELTVPPYSTSTSVLPQLPPETIPSGSVILQMDGEPGELLSDIQAVADTRDGPVSVTLPWKDAKQVDNAGEHPWAVGDSLLSTVLLFNPDQDLKNSSVRFQIHTERAVWTKQLQIAPLTTSAISINDIIEKELTDDKGNRLPADSSAGIITWSSLANPRVFGKLVQLDEIALTSKTYACSQFNPICGAVMSNAYVYTPVGQTAEEDVIVQDCDNGGFPGSCDCYDSCGGEAGSGASYSWSSANPDIASLTNDPASNYGLFQGNAVGEAFVNVNLGDVNGCGASAGGQLYVQPSVSIQVQNGYTDMQGGIVLLGGAGGVTSTAITGNGNPGGGSYTWSTGPNLQISGFNSQNASVSGTASSSSRGDTYISLAYVLNGQTGSTSLRFTVLNPTTFQATSTGGSQDTQPVNQGNGSGYITRITYYAHSQLGTPNEIQVPGIPFTEVLTTISNPYNGTFDPPDGTPRTQYSSLNGDMPDDLSVVIPGGIPPDFSASRSQSFTVNGFQFQPAQTQSYSASSGTIATTTLTR